MSRMNPRRMEHQRQQRPSLSPWEGGITPGGGGLLPTPPSLLNQFSSPEAQLAVASNLLTSLLRPVQNSLQSNQIPSLMGASGSGGSFGGQYGQMQQQPMFQDNYSRGNYRDFPDSQASNNQERNYDSYRNRSPGHIPPKRFQQSNRGRQDTSGKSRSADQKQRDTKRNEPDKKDSPGTAANEKRGASFEGLPKAAFHCHICKKDMWDAQSFDNHVRGMAHQKMLGEREKTYHVKAELIRHEAKLEEQQNQIELERLMRMGKKVNPGRREFCKMCDFAFLGDLGLHRKSKIHQSLKSFLHPKCSTCSKEFPLRIELDKHVLTSEHLKKLFKIKKVEIVEIDLEHDASKDAKKKDGQQEGEETEGKAGAEAGGKIENEGDEVIEDMEMSTDDVKSGVAENQVQDSKTAEVEVKPEKEDSKTSNLKIYNPDVTVGEEFLMPVTGMFCKACRRFFLNDDKTLQSHCRTLGHFNNYTALKKQECQALMATEVQPAEEKMEEESKEIEKSKKEEASSEEAQTSVKRMLPEESVDKGQGVKRLKSEDLYDPLEATTPSPSSEFFDDESLISKELDELAAAIKEEDEKQVNGQEETDTKEKNSGNSPSKARRGRSFARHARGKC